MSREGRSKWILLLFGFSSVFLLCGVVSYQRESSRTRAPHLSQATIASRNLSLTVVHDHGYLLELNSSDAMTGGAMNVMSIQCHDGVEVESKADCGGTLCHEFDFRDLPRSGESGEL